MLKVKVLTMGKTKEKWTEEAIQEYEKRLSPSLEITWIIAKDANSLKVLCDKEKNLISLDPKGVLLTSEEWSQKMMTHFQDLGSSLTIVIGGPEGISKEILKKSLAIYSFSLLTFTHQLTRIILVEQLYRALEIQKGSQYHK